MLMKDRGTDFTFFRFEILMIVMILLLGVVTYVAFQDNGIVDREEQNFINKVEGIIQSQGMQTRRAYFRQEQCFLSCTPIMKNSEYIKEVSRRI